MIAEFFGITIDQLIGCKIPKKESAKDRHVLVTLMSSGLSFLIAGIAFVILLGFEIPNAWMLFIYALPISFIVAIVFCAMWFSLKWTASAVSCLVWTSGLCAYLSIWVYTGTANLWFIFIVCFIFQILVVLWFIWQHKHIKSKKERELAEKRSQNP
jgi:cation transport ATPase